MAFALSLHTGDPSRLATPLLAVALPADKPVPRTLAPLDKLLGYAQQMADKHTVCLFLKGQSLASELTEARKSWRMKALQHPSATDPSGVILEVREFRHVQSKHW